MSEKNVTEISQKIVGFRVEEAKIAERKEPQVQLQSVSETMRIPDELPATRYKLRTPLSEAALYVNISDIILNEGTPFERRQPIEVFINSRDTKAYQYVTAMTRLISAILRKGGDVTFIVEELKSIHDPNGGYMGRGGIWVPSLVAEIGAIIEKHMVKLGLINKELAPEQITYIENKKAEMVEMGINPDEGERCPNCSAMTYVRMEGCYTCTSCGHSRCG